MQNFNNQSLKEKIINLVKNENGRPIPAGIILKKLSNHHLNFNDKKKIYNTIDELIRERVFFKLKSNSIVLSRNNHQNNENRKLNTENKLEGYLSINTNGNGFISLNKNEKAKYFVNKNDLNFALNNDKVQFITYENSENKSLIGAKIIGIIEHTKDYYVGLYTLNKDGSYSIKIDDPKFYLQVMIDDNKGLVDGNKILLHFIKFENDIAYCKLIKVIGHKNDVGVDILSIVYNNGVEPDFDEETLSYARNINLNIDENERKIRRDLTKLPIITIDPKTSKDFDDAIYVKKNESDYFLSVSIADVSHYVKYHSILDEQALKRGCSIYLVDRVIPMLPHNLSDDICSLNPNVERLAITCDVNINSEGIMSNINIYPSIIKNQRRFSYDEVNDFFNKKSNLDNDHEEIKQMLLTSLELHKILDKAKLKRGYINFNIPQPIIVVNEKGEPIEIKKYESGQAQRMIEDFMVIANEAVTKFAEQNKWPFVYRLHDKPNEESMKTFMLEAKKLGFKINSDIKNVKPLDISKWIKDNETNPNLSLISMLLLRSMAKAEYDTKNIGHFGLALKDYTHFTSPIRRYPDLMIHRIFWMYYFKKQQTSNELREKMANELSERSSLSSSNELKAIKCEREVNAMKFAEYMQKHIGDEFDGFVTSVNPYGVFVQLDNTVEGLIKLANLKNDYYQFNENTNQLIGKKSNSVLTLGKKIRVKVILADKNISKVEFEFVKFN